MLVIYNFRNQSNKADPNISLFQNFTYLLIKELILLFIKVKTLHFDFAF
jgi:hypothetical protein